MSSEACYRLYAAGITWREVGESLDESPRWARKRAMEYARSKGLPWPVEPLAPTTLPEVLEKHRRGGMDDTLIALLLGLTPEAVAAVPAPEFFRCAGRLEKRQPPSICHRTGKWGYNERSYAMKAPNYTGHKLYTYRCQFCGTWHRTKQDPRYYRKKGAE